MPSNLDIQPAVNRVIDILNASSIGGGASTGATKIWNGTSEVPVLNTTPSNSDYGLVVRLVGAIPVTIASAIEITNDAGNAIPVSATSLPLPAGAATETTLSTLNTKVQTLNTGAVTISTALPTGSNTIGGVNIISALPTGTNDIGSIIVSNKPTTITSSASVTRPNDTTQYAVGDGLGGSVLSFSVGKVNAGSGLIIGANLIDSANQTVKGDFDLLLFDTNPTSTVADNATQTLTDANLENAIGVIRFQAIDAVQADTTTGVGGNAIYLSNFTNTMTFKCGASTQNIHGILITRSAYAPVAQEKFTIRLRVIQD